MPRLPKSYKPKTQKAVDRKTYANDAIYNSKRWKALREHHMQSQPLCVWCEEEGITKPGDIVDHIKEISDGGDPFDQNNLQTMCHKHHNQKTKWAAKKRYKPNTETRGISSAG